MNLRPYQHETYVGARIYRALVPTLQLKAGSRGPPPSR